MALQPVSQKDVLAVCLKKEDVRKVLQRRSIDILETKLAYEGNKIESQMRRLAKEHWALAWKSEVESDADNENNFEQPLTDAKRNILRSLARPLSGCRCGSKTHELINDPKCPLYRDVKLFASSSRSDYDVSPDIAKKSSINTKARNALEAAYIERFKTLRAESESAKKEAEFVLNMEIKQTSEMGKAVLSPTSLCTVVLSAVASVTDEVTNDTILSSNAAALNEEMIAYVNSDDDSDEDDLPLNALANIGSKRDSAASSDGSFSKRPKLINSNAETAKTKATPNPHSLAKILRHISKTHGHVFQEPSHADYAWYVFVVQCFNSH
eukprot:scaffold85108_cov59-Cyclotella_meneghiniana.AAC.3